MNALSFWVTLFLALSSLT
ncbi:putative gap repair protein, partial [Serratia symbiotica str. Tucson]